MTTNNTVPATDGTPSPDFQLIHLLYALALLAASLATFGVAGSILALPVLGFWAYVYFSRSRPRSLAYGCLTVLACCCLIALLLPHISVAREAARRVQCGNNLKSIVLALMNYHDDHGAFPPAFIADEDGKPMHSWRVLLLPYVEESPRYEEYNFQEPWDGPNNRQLLTPIPRDYACPSDTRIVLERRVQTSYVAAIGPRTAWPGPFGRKASEMPDGTGSTILVLEDHSMNIPWMEPRDLPLDEALAVLTSPDPQAAGPHRSEDFFFDNPGGRNVAFADGSLAFLCDGLPRHVWSALLTVDDGISLYDLDLPARADGRKRLKIGNCYRLGVFVLLTLFPLPWVWRKPKPAETPGRDIDAGRLML